MSTKPFTFKSPLPPTDLFFSSMVHTAQLSTLEEMQLQLLSKKPDLSPDDLLGQKVQVDIELRDGSVRHISGYVTRFGIGVHQGKYFGYQAVVRPWLWFLTRTNDCRIFQDLTVPDIIKTVFDDHGGLAEFEFKLSRSYRQRTYCVQYRESDFNFVARLLEDEGIYWYFKHAEGSHKLVMVDDAAMHDDVQGHTSLPYYEDTGQVPPDTEFLTGWRFAREVQPGKSVLTSYDFEKPSTNLKVDHSDPRSHNLADYEVFDFQGDYLKKSDGQQQVDTRLVERQARYDRSSAGGNAHALECGLQFTLERHPRGDQNQKYLLVRAEVSARDNGAESQGDPGSLHCAIQTIPASQQFRPPRVTPKPFVQGPQTALVVGPAGEEIYTDKYGRVKLQFHWDRYGERDEKSSCWTRVSTPWAGKSFGFVQIPRIGQEVVVDFLEGDPDQPLVTGRVYNAEQMPPWELPANATQSGVLTRSSKGGNYGNANAIRFEDKKGSEQLWIHAEKNQDIEVENDETHWVGRDQTTTVNRHQIVSVDKGREVFVNGVSETSGTGESYYVKGPRIGYFDGKTTQTITQGADMFVTGSWGEFTTGDRKTITTGPYIFQANNAYFTAGPECLVTAAKVGLVASGGELFLESSADTNAKAANFKFSSMGNFNFFGNQFNRTIFEGNDTVLGPNTNCYIGVSRDTQIGSASAAFIGTQNSVTTGMSTDGYMGMQVSNFLGLSMSNSVALSMDNALLSMGMTAIDLTLCGISLDQNAIKMLNAGGASGPGAATMFSAGPGIAAMMASAFGLGFSAVFGVSQSIDAYQQAKRDADALINTEGLSPATKARLQRVLNNSTGFFGAGVSTMGSTDAQGNPVSATDRYGNQVAGDRQGTLNNVANPPPAAPAAPAAEAPPTPAPPTNPHAG